MASKVGSERVIGGESCSKSFKRARERSPWIRGGDATLRIQLLRQALAVPANHTARWPPLTQTA